MKQFKNKDTAFLVMTGLVLIMLASPTTNTSPQPVNTVQGSWDISDQVTQAGLNQYLIEEKDFDYNHPEVYALAQNLKTSSTDPYTAVKKTAQTVIQKITYDSKVTVSSCYAETASSALKLGKGDCVSMSRLATALLRAQGIPARTMGGCLTFKSTCSPAFSVFPNAQPQVTPLQAGDYKKRGFLHEWVEVWTPTQGWVLLEATAGQIYPLTCQSYVQYGYDTNQYDRCVINDATFWNQCAIA